MTCQHVGATGSPCSMSERCSIDELKLNKKTQKCGGGDEDLQGPTTACLYRAAIVMEEVKFPVGTIIQLKSEEPHTCSVSF